MISESLNTHPLRFPAFNNPISPLGDTPVYAEIALKIFKKLKLRDLCQAKLVCKEWKQLIKSSFLDEEEAYTQALKRAIQKKDVIKEAFCIEKLGDLYAKKETSETLLQAAGLYNYALHRSPCSENNIREKLANVEILLIKLCHGESLDCALIAKHFEGNREILKKFREDIEAKIQALGSDPSTGEVRKLYGEIAQQIKKFFRHIAIQVFDILGSAPCEYAMIGFGSLAREEMTPYSDLEFGILIQEDTSINREYFKRLVTLIHLKVINLGETILPALNIHCLKAIEFFDGITPRGFAFDGAGVEGKGCKTPFGNGKTFELIQTPEKMAQYVAKDEKGHWWHKKEPHLPMELLTFTHLLGNPELIEQYRQKVQEKLDIPYQEGLNLRQYLAKLHLVPEDMENFDPRIRALNKEGMLFKAKDDFYRFPHLALDRLALFKGVLASDTFGRIDQLEKQEIVTNGAAVKLKEWINIALFMRLKTYSYYQAQKEMMNPLIKPFGFDDSDLIKRQFSLDPEALKKIKKIYHIFIPFYQAIKEFLGSNEEKLKSFDLDDRSPETKGMIALRLFQYEKAKSYYLRAEQETPQNPMILTTLGRVNYELGDLKEAVEYFKKAFRIYFHAKTHFMVASLYNNLGQVYKRQGDLRQAVEETKKAIEINLTLFGENHFSLENNYNNLGMIFLDQGNLKQAAEYTKKARDINLSLKPCNENGLAVIYNNLGTIYGQLEIFKKATGYIKKAFTILLNLYGEKHSKLALLHDNLASIYLNDKDLKKAIEHSQRALDIDIKFFGENHSFIATSYNTWGMIHRAQGHLEQAADYVNKALTLDLKLFGENHSSVALRYENLGMIYHDQGNLEQAEEYTKKARSIYFKAYGAIHPRMASVHNNLGRIYHDRGHLGPALKCAKKSLAINLKLLGENHPSVAKNYSNLGQIYQEQGKLKRAFKYAEKARIISLKFFAEIHPHMASIYSNLSIIYSKRNNNGLAIVYAEKALAIDIKLLGENHSSVAIGYNNLGQIYKDQRDFKQAAKFTKKGLDIILKLFGENHPSVAIGYKNLGAICQDQGALDKALLYTKKFIEISLRLHGADSGDVLRGFTALGIIYHRQGKSEQATKCFKQASKK
jgi:tetratricopeptide (TPR) repeat protein